MGHRYHSLKDTESRRSRFIPKLRLKRKRKAIDVSDMISNDFFTTLQIDIQRQIARDIIVKSKERNRRQKEIDESVAKMKNLEFGAELIEKWINGKMEIIHAIEKEIDCAQQKGERFTDLIMSKC